MHSEFCRVRSRLLQVVSARLFSSFAHGAKVAHEAVLMKGCRFRRVAMQLLKSLRPAQEL
jgi:hypothetical protein